MFELRPCAFGILFEIYQDESVDILHNVLRHYIENTIMNKIKQKTEITPQECYGNVTAASMKTKNNSSRNQFTTTMGNFSEMLSDYSTIYNNNKKI